MTGPAEMMLALARQTLRDPRAGARALLAMNLPMVVRSGGLVLTAVLSTLLLQPSFALLPPSDDPAGSFLAASPLRTALVQWAVLFLSSVLIHRVGRAFGGRGGLADAMLLVAWLQILMLAVQLAQLGALILVPPLSGLVGLAGFALFLWLLVHFVAELHGFTRLGAVLAGILLTFFVTVFLGAILLTLAFGPEAFTDV